MFMTKFSVTASLAFLTTVAYMGATPLPNGISSSGGGQLLASRGLGPALPGGSSDKPIHTRGVHFRRAAVSTSDIQTIQINIKMVDNLLADLQRRALPKSLTRDQARDVNTKIEQILAILSQSKDAGKAIANAFPQDGQAATAMNTIVEAGKSFGTALTGSKRPVGGDGTKLSANIKKAQDLLAPVTKAYNTLIRMAQGTN